MLRKEKKGIEINDECTTKVLETCKKVLEP
jgi:hypothetical protein